MADNIDKNKSNIRNFSIIAHIDHGKSTLADRLLQMTGAIETRDIKEQMLDNMDIERERGITIYSKNCSVMHNNVKINIVDTPGHADFSSEVERIIKTVDTVILLVDSSEGPMPQTRFVLKKALEAKVKPIVLINKVDRPVIRIEEVIEEVISLFLELGADDNQLDFPIIYTSGLMGTLSLEKELESQKEDFNSLFDLILEKIKEPDGDVEADLQFQPALLDYNDYVGKIGIGKISNGSIKVNDVVSCVRLDKSIKQFRIQKLFGFKGLKKIEIEQAFAGDIIAIAGLEDINVGETICNVNKEKALPILKIDEPTLQMMFSVNNSPFSGKEGKFITARKIEERLFKAIQSDVSLKVENLSNDTWSVSGRGELHLSILIENLRREGYEFQVSKPEVIIKEIDGIKNEPFEELQIEVSNELVGTIIESLGRRGGNLDSINNFNDFVRIIYTIPSRGLIGYMTDFMTLTKGYGILNHTFKEYAPIQSSNIGERNNGVLVSMENGKSTAYSMGQLEDRGILFIEPGTEIYEGMIIGECNKEGDLAVNVIKGKQLTNMRTSNNDKAIVLKRPRLMSLETCLDYINNDELVEITPLNIRLRKKVLNTNDRKRIDKRNN